MWTPLMPVSPRAGREGRNWGSSLLALPDLERVVWELIELPWDIPVSQTSPGAAPCRGVGVKPCPKLPVCKTVMNLRAGPQLGGGHSR